MTHLSERSTGQPRNIPSQSRDEVKPFRNGILNRPASPANKSFRKLLPNFFEAICPAQSLATAPASTRNPATRSASPVSSAKS